MADTDSHPPSVDIIIPYYKRRDMLERCLDSLAQTSYPAMGIIVVDNGGVEAGLVFLVKRYPNTRLVRLPENRGYAGGCNEGLKHSVADYVVFMNDDTEHEPRWLEQLVAAALDDDRIAALQPKILSQQSYRKGRKIFDYAGAAGGMIDRLGYPFCLGRTFSKVETDNGQYDEGRDIFWASGVAMFVKRAVAAELGGFDEDFFMQMEEIDLSWRIKLAGYRICSVPSSVVLHTGGASLPGGSVEKIYFNHRNNLVMILKNRSLTGLLWVIPLRVLLEIVAALFYLTRFPGALKKSGAVFRAMAYTFKKLGTSLKKRSKIQQTRVAGDRLLFLQSPVSAIAGISR